MLLFVHELHSPENRAGPSWAEETQGGGPGQGAAAEVGGGFDEQTQRSDPRICATSLFTNPAPDHPERPRLLKYATSSTC